MVHIDRTSGKPTITRGADGSSVTLKPSGVQGPVGPSGGPIPAGGSPGLYPTPDGAGGHEWDDPGATYAAHTDLDAWRGPLDMVESMYAAAFPTLAGVPPTLSVSGPGGASPIATPTLLAYDTALVTRIGCLPILKTQFSTNYHQNGVNGTWTAPPWAVEFVIDSNDFAMRFRPETTNGNSTFWITVDGQPISRKPFVPTTNIAAGSLSYLRLQFSGAARQRRIRIYMALIDFGGLDVPAGTTVTATSTTGVNTVAILGDSWVEGTTQAAYPYTISNILARTLGWHPYLCGQGGTGYTTAGAGGGREKLGGTNRLADIYAVAPSHVIVFGSQNDDGAANIQTEAAALYSALATNLPAAKVLVVGPQSHGSTPSANRLANRDAVKAAADAATNVTAFIDPLVQNWVTGTGRLTARTGDGNADYMLGADGLHPSEFGAHYYGRRMAGELVRELLADGLTY